MPKIHASVVVYLVRPTHPNLKIVDKQVRFAKKTVEGRQGEMLFHIIFYGRKPIRDARLLNPKYDDALSQGSSSFTGDIDISGADLVSTEGGSSGNRIVEHLWAPSFYVLDDDVLSLEEPLSFRQTFVDHNTLTALKVADSIVKLQKQTGIIPLIRGKGGISKLIGDAIVRLRHEYSHLRLEEQSEPSKITQLIIIDRTYDLYTPMLTQLTYEGLVDEYIGIHGTVVEVPLGKGSKAKTSKQLFNSADTVFADVRDVNFSALAGILAKRGEAIQLLYDRSKSVKGFEEMAQFFTNLAPVKLEHQKLAVHDALLDILSTKTRNRDFFNRLAIEQGILGGFTNEKEVFSWVENQIFSHGDIYSILRILCLFSLVNNGIKQKRIDSIKLEISQMYGWLYVFLFDSLEMCGLLKKHGGKSNFTKLVKALHLNQEVDEFNPDDVSYVFSCFAPLSVRTVELMLQSLREEVTELTMGVVNFKSGPSVGGGVVSDPASTTSRIVHTSAKERKRQREKKEESLRLLHPVQSFEIVQNLPPGCIASTLASNDTLKHRGIKEGEVLSKTIASQGTCLVFFVGGVTYGEIAGLRFLSKGPPKGGAGPAGDFMKEEMEKKHEPQFDEDGRPIPAPSIPSITFDPLPVVQTYGDIIIGATEILNGTSMMEQCRERLSFTEDEAERKNPPGGMLERERKRMERLATTGLLDEKPVKKESPEDDKKGSKKEKEKRRGRRGKILGRKK
eukprot:gnl/Carplike_NY0171/4438_a6026_221.p1 GENE.gnl/Carplike_NY0171/4438_a6026_221~~gnl/Carplike_NY0171/4438_a6026_221.p1  ORF type:complete len:747 (+),score=191.34 gnl/Carplike_NY0171/4438_a6026_221:47-2242(+)